MPLLIVLRGTIVNPSSYQVSEPRKTKTGYYRIIIPRIYFKAHVLLCVVLVLVSLVIFIVKFCCCLDYYIHGHGHEISSPVLFYCYCYCLPPSTGAREKHGRVHHDDKGQHHLPPACPVSAHFASSSGPPTARQRSASSSSWLSTG